MRTLILSVFVGLFTFGAQATQVGTEVLLTCREDAVAAEALEVLLVKSQGKTFLLSSLNENPVLLQRTSLNSYESSGAGERVTFRRIKDLNFELRFNQNSYLLNCQLAAY